MIGSSLILSIDQGTTNTKALLVNRDGVPVYRTSAPLKLYTPQPGFVEQDPLEIWESVRQVSNECMGWARDSRGSVEGLTISNQRETAVAWHRGTGEPLAPAVSWQCRRSSSFTKRWLAHAEAIRRTTGLPLDPVLSATKWVWLLENVPAVERAAATGDLCFGTVDSWLLFKLSGHRLHATDFTNASRTGLLDLETLAWSPVMLATFGIPASALPMLHASACCFGRCADLADVPIVAALGDSHAALAGHGAFAPGTVKATYGTGSSLMTLTPALVEDTPQLARTIAWTISGSTQYALEGNIFMTGSAVQWVGEFLELSDPTAGALALAATVQDAAGAYFVPAMAGLGAPHWNADARGLFYGMTRSHTAAHLARAALDAIAFQVADVFFAMREAAGTELPCLRADGGASRNRELMQMQADILGVPVLRAHTEELSALGAAYLGAITLGWWPTLADVASLPRGVDRTPPLMASERRNEFYAGWHDAVQRTRMTIASGRGA